MVRQLVIGAFLLLNWIASVFSAPASRRDSVSQRLRFKQDGTFQISVFNDLHYGEGRAVFLPSYLVFVSSVHQVFFLKCSYILSRNPDFELTYMQLRIWTGAHSKISIQPVL